MDLTLYKVISLNIHHGRDVSEVEKIKEQALLISNFDIALIQEAERNTERNKNRDLLVELSHLSGLRNLSHALWHPYTGGDYGVGVLSKHRILEESTLLLPSVAIGETRDIDSKIRKIPEQRGVHMVKIMLASVPILIANTHSSLWRVEREVSDAVLTAILTASDLPTIVGGDLNIESEEEYRNLRKFKELSPGNLPTYPAQMPIKAIDKLFGHGITVINSYVLPNLVSDHRAIGLEFTVER